MAFLPRPRLFGLLLVLTILPLVPAAEALAAAAAATPSRDGPEAERLSVEARLRRIAGAVRERESGSAEGLQAAFLGEDEPATTDQPAAAGSQDPAAAQAIPDDVLAYVFVNGPRVGWRNGGFYNGGFRNGGFWNGGFRNGGGWRNGGFGNGGFRNGGGFRNFW